MSKFGGMRRVRLLGLAQRGCEEAATDGGSESRTSTHLAGQLSRTEVSLTRPASSQVLLWWCRATVFLRETLVSRQGATNCGHPRHRCTS